MTAEFCDTNVLVYAYDRSAGMKQEKARTLLNRLWSTGIGVISVQVLQELFVGVTRKLPLPLDHRTARTLIADLAQWEVVAPGPGDVLDAIDLVEEYSVSFWDAMILVAAGRANAEIVWSEDLGDRQTYRGVTVRNPFSVSL